jgi:hypothetical protein
MGTVWIQVPGPESLYIRAAEIQALRGNEFTLEADVRGWGADEGRALLIQARPSGEWTRPALPPEFAAQLAVLIGRYADTPGNHVLTPSYADAPGWHWVVETQAPAGTPPAGG